MTDNETLGEFLTLDEFLSREAGTLNLSDSDERAAPTEQYRIATLATFSGPVSISEERSRKFTYFKTVTELHASLTAERSQTLERTLERLNGSKAEHGLVFKGVLESLSDRQFKLLVEALLYVSPRVFIKYIEILASLPVSVGGRDGQISTRVRSEGKTSEDPSGRCEKESLENDHTQGSRDGIDPPNTYTAPGETIPSTDTASLCSRFHDLPLEISHLIEDMFVIDCFFPKRVFPRQTPDEKGQHHFEGKTYNTPRPAAFLGLNRRMVEEYKKLYYGENVWVIGPGDTDQTTGFLFHINGNWLRIRKVYLSFSTDDDEEASDLLNIVQRNMRIGTGCSKLDNVKLLERFATRCEESSRRVQEIWWSKFSHVARLKLDQLTLDFRNAYAPDNEFLARHSWVRSLTQFRFGLPRVLNILAPTNAIKADLEIFFSERNPQRNRPDFA